MSLKITQSISLFFFGGDFEVGWGDLRERETEPKRETRLFLFCTGCLIESETEFKRYEGREEGSSSAHPRKAWTLSETNRKIFFISLVDEKSKRESRAPSLFFGSRRFSLCPLLTSAFYFKMRRKKLCFIVKLANQSVRFLFPPCHGRSEG